MSRDKSKIELTDVQATSYRCMSSGKPSPAPRSDMSAGMWVHRRNHMTLHHGPTPAPCRAGGRAWFLCIRWSMGSRFGSDRGRSGELL